MNFIEWLFEQIAKFFQAQISEAENQSEISTSEIVTPIAPPIAVGSEPPPTSEFNVGQIGLQPGKIVTSPYIPNSLYRGHGEVGGLVKPGGNYTPDFKRTEIDQDIKRSFVDAMLAFRDSQSWVISYSNINAISTYLAMHPKQWIPFKVWARAQTALKIDIKYDDWLSTERSDHLVTTLIRPVDTRPRGTLVITNADYIVKLRYDDESAYLTSSYDAASMLKSAYDKEGFSGQSQEGYRHPLHDGFTELAVWDFEDIANALHGWVMPPMADIAAWLASGNSGVPRHTFIPLPMTWSGYTSIYENQIERELLPGKYFIMPWLRGISRINSLSPSYPENRNWTANKDVFPQIAKTWGHGMLTKAAGMWRNWYESQSGIGGGQWIEIAINKKTLYRPLIISDLAISDRKASTWRKIVDIQALFLSRAFSAALGKNFSKLQDTVATKYSDYSVIAENVRDFKNDWDDIQRDAKNAIDYTVEGNVSLTP